jgi:hypothetical protein
MNVKSTLFKLVLYFFIIIYAFYINYHFANKGLYPIDTFSFFDTGYYVTKGLHPIKDFWVISGILADYLQGLFFYIFGLNWNAYVFHASFLNIVISLFFFYFLNQFNKSIIFNFFLSLSVATLCYPVIGTPFPYQHSFIFSIISLLIFYSAVYKKDKIYWTILPIIMLLSFFSMQLPSGIINFLIIIFSLIYFISFNKIYFKYFLFGSLISLLIVFLYFVITKVSFNDFYTQLILFPMTVGQGRIINEESAFEGAKLINKFTLRGAFGHFKFIHIFLLANLALIIMHIKKLQKKFRFNEIILLNIFVLLCSIGFIFHQLITANQTFIFSLIPILCGLFIIQLNDAKLEKYKNIIKAASLIIIIFVTFKYHLEYNEKRKFVDLQGVNFSKALNASTIDKRFNNLLWITPNYSQSPKNEIDLLKKTIETIKNDPKKKMLITHYQFFALLIDDNLSIPNRWYFPNNTFPSTYQNKYYKRYIEKFDQILNKKNIDIIYVVETYPGELQFLNFKELLKNRCFIKKQNSQILYSIKLVNCN